MKTLALIVLSLAAGVLPAADPTTRDRAKAKAALALAFASAEVQPPAAAAKPDTPATSAAKAALKDAFGFSCDCDPCDVPCPNKCGCERCGCAGDAKFPRPMESAVPPKASPVKPAAMPVTTVTTVTAAADEPITEATRKYKDALRMVETGVTVFIYVGYTPPERTANTFALSSFDGKTKGVFRCFLHDGKPSYEERPDMIPMRTEYRTKTVMRKQCVNGTCSWVPETITEAVQVPVEGGQ